MLLLVHDLVKITKTAPNKILKVRIIVRAVPRLYLRNPSRLTITSLQETLLMALPYTSVTIVHSTSLSEPKEMPTNNDLKA